MLYDVAVMEAIYGATPVHNPGNDVYRYGGGFQTAFRTIYDTGGIDTIDASNQFWASTINLAPGSFSEIGSIDLSIAFSTWIENAVGSSNRDSLSGNDIANVLSGGDGNDQLNGLGGDDTLKGQKGNDTYQVRIANGNDTIADQGNGTDILEIHSHIPGSLGLDDFTQDLAFSRVGSNLIVHLALNDGADEEGTITIRGGSGNRIETLKLVDVDGSQIGDDVDLVKIRNAATFVPTQFKLTAASTSFGRIAVPV